MVHQFQIWPPGGATCIDHSFGYNGRRFYCNLEPLAAMFSFFVLSSFFCPFLFFSVCLSTIFHMEIFALVGLEFPLKCFRFPLGICFTFARFTYFYCLSQLFHYCCPPSIYLFLQLLSTKHLFLLFLRCLFQKTKFQFCFLGIFENMSFILQNSLFKMKGKCKNKHLCL